jgi:hypothetical protein
LHRKIECSANSRALLEDGLQLFLVGDIPPMLLAEVVADLRMEVRHSLSFLLPTELVSIYMLIVYAKGHSVVGCYAAKRYVSYLHVSTSENSGELV